MLTLQPNDFRPAYWNQVSFDHPHKKLSQSTPTLKQVIFGEHTKTKSISIPELKTASISIHILKPSNFQPAHKTEVDFDPRTKNYSRSTPTIKPISISHVKLYLISTPSLNASQFLSPL